MMFYYYGIVLGLFSLLEFKGMIYNLLPHVLNVVMFLNH
jgi:hypothetical protein